MARTTATRTTRTNQTAAVDTTLETPGSAASKKGKDIAPSLMTVIQLWQIISGAGPQPAVQKPVKVCLNCNESTADFNWMHQLKPLIRIQWKFKDIVMSSYRKTELNITQESLTISQEYKGRFHLLQPGGVGFSLSSVTAADIGTYRLLVVLETGVLEILEGDLEEIDRKNMVEVCSHENAVFNWTLRKEQPFSLIQWQFNGTTFANTTKKGLSSDSLDISADYKPRFSLLHPGDVGFQLENVRREDTGTYTCIITSQSGGFTIEGDLEVKDQQSGNFRISTNRKQRTLTCGDRRESKYSWIFSNTTGRENQTSTGHELPLSSIPQKGSVYCLRQSDCTSSLTYSFSSGVKICMQMSPCDHNDPAMRQDVSAGEVPEEGGSNIAAVVVPIILASIIIFIIILVQFCACKGERGRISSETGGGESA